MAECIGVNLHSDDIAIANPIQTFNTDHPPKIIVKFTRRKTRNKFYASRKLLHKKKAKDLPHLRLRSSNPIFISESLTPKRKRLFGEVNKIKKKFKWRFIWSRNGRIFLKDKENSTAYSFHLIMTKISLNSIRTTLNVYISCNNLGIRRYPPSEGDICPRKFSDLFLTKKKLWKVIKTAF